LIPFEADATSSKKQVIVTFNNGDRSDKHEITISAGKTEEVACKL